MKYAQSGHKSRFDFEEVKVSKLQSSVIETTQNNKKAGSESCRSPICHFKDFGFYSGYHRRHWRVLITEGLPSGLPFNGITLVAVLRIDYRRERLDTGGLFSECCYIVSEMTVLNPGWYQGNEKCLKSEIYIHIYIFISIYLLYYMYISHMYI